MAWTNAAVMGSGRPDVARHRTPHGRIGAPRHARRRQPGLRCRAAAPRDAGPGGQRRTVPRPVPPWPLAVPGGAFQPSAGRGVARRVRDDATARCAVCGRAWPRRLDGSVVIAHRTGSGRCEGSGQSPAWDLALVSWLPVLTGLSPHACGTATRPGWTRPASRRSSSLNGWDTKYPECAVSTATSATPCGPSTSRHCKSAGQPTP
jgi:hypothetical protein